MSRCRRSRRGKNSPRRHKNGAAGGAMKLLVFGFGYSAHHIAERLRATGTQVTATVRGSEKAGLLTQAGITARIFSDGAGDAALPGDIAASDAILISIPPAPAGDL